MRKKWRAALPGLLCALLLAQGASAAAVEVTVDGEPLAGEAIVRDALTYVPLRSLLSALGGWETGWDAPARAAYAVTEFCTLTAPVGAVEVLADGSPYGLAGEIVLYGDRTYVPLRSVAELLGAEVTFTAWDEPIAVAAAEETAYTEEDLYWLSRIIAAESRGESLRGQIAVGNVVLNRVESPKFPDTVREVIFDRRDAVQFEPVENGTVYDDPDAQSVLAARLALGGAREVGTCMYFYAPALSQGLWINQNCVYYATIGCHRFYRD